MSKEVFVAVSVGFILGLLITFGVWTTNKNLSAPTAKKSPPAPTLAVISPSPVPQTGIFLNVDVPVNETVQNSDAVKLSGKSLPGAVIAITYENGEGIVVADSAGNFSKEIKLDTGYNRFVLTAFDTKGSSATKNLLVTFTTSKI
jgi:hypothetical protein